MPEYRSNPFYGDPRVLQGAASLADALIPNQREMMELDLAQAQAAAQIDRDYSGSYANQALAAERFAGADYNRAQTAEVNAGLAAAEKMHETFQRTDMDWDQKLTLASSYAMQAGYDVEDLLPLLPAWGANQSQIGMTRQAAGTPFQDTYQGAQYATSNELLEGVGANGQPAFLPRGQLGFNPGFRPIMSETNAKGETIMGLPLQDRQNLAISDMPGETVLGADGGFTFVPRADAFGQTVVSTPSAKDMAAGAAGGGASGNAVEGTGVAVWAANTARNISAKIRAGQPLSEAERADYQFALAKLSEPAVRWESDGKGGMTPITVTQDISSFAPLPAPGQAPQMTPPSAGLSFGSGVPQAPQFSFLQTPPAPAAAPISSNAPTSPAPTLSAAPTPGQMPLPPATVGGPSVPRGAPTMPGAPQIDVGNRIQIGTEPPPAFTEAQGRFKQYTSRIMNGGGNLFALLGYDITSGGFRPDAWSPSASDQFIGEVAPDNPFVNAVRPLLLDREAEVYQTVVAQTLNPLIRADSGAAVPEGEYPRYYAQYIPRANEDPLSAKLKMDQLAVTIAAFAEVSADPTFREILAAADAQEMAGNTGAANAGYQKAQRVLWAAKGRIAQELGVDLAAEIYGNPQTTTTPATAPAQTQAPAAGPQKITLPGGLEVEVYPEGWEP